MKKAITFERAALISLILLGSLILLHASVLIGILLFDYAPIDFLWGGKMETAEQLLKFETASLLTSLIFFFLVLMHTQRLSEPRLRVMSRIAMWIMFFLFTLNTIGNLLAESTFEKFFAIITALLAFLMLRIALEKRTDKA